MFSQLQQAMSSGAAPERRVTTASTWTSTAPARRGHRGPVSLAELADRVATLVAAVFARQATGVLYMKQGTELVPAAGVGAADARQLLASIRTRLAAARQPLATLRAIPGAELSRRRSALVAPVLCARGELCGLVIAEATQDGPDFTDADLEALQGVAGLAAPSLEQLGPGQRERARAELDRRSARLIQRGLMSSALPWGIGVTVSAEYLPALDVGGDFYSARHLSDGSVWATIGDVSGNGVSAALLMSRVAADFEQGVAAQGAPERTSPAEVLANVQARLTGLDTERFVTAACIRIDAARRRVRIANAGHLPVVVRRADGATFTFGGASGAPLGVGPGGWIDEDLCVDAGDILLLMTDGLLEALDHPSGHQGLELVLDLVRASAHDPEVVSEHLRAAVDLAQREHFLDDLTWVALQITA